MTINWIFHTENEMYLKVPREKRKYDKPRNPNGRPVGIKNKVTRKAREAITAFIDETSEDIGGWVNEIYRDNGAKDALTAYVALLEFAIPKLARYDVKSEVTITADIEALQRARDRIARMDESTKMIEGTYERIQELS